MDQKVNDSEKLAVIAKLDELYPKGWKRDLAERIEYKRQAVSAWANKPQRKSKRIEKAARRLIQEGEKIRKIQEKSI